MTLILRTAHGSRLYGLAKPESDYDWYEVWDDGIDGVFHWMDGRNDTTQVDISTWLEHCDRGVPQALEAMFAPARFATVDKFAAMRSGYRANVGNAAETYTRTIAKFMEGTPKQRLAAHRLRHDLNEMRRYGRFDPTAYGRTRVKEK